MRSIGPGEVMIAKVSHGKSFVPAVFRTFSMEKRDRKSGKPPLLKAKIDIVSSE
jgi:hypothetical protein